MVGALYGRQERQREQLAKDCCGVLGRFRAWREAARTDGRSLHPGNLPVDWYTLNRWVLEEKMEQVREIEGERAYEEMRRNVERASQPPPRMFRSAVA